MHDLRVLDVGHGYLDLEVLSSKGYYVRALARDLGDALHCPAHLGSLRRVRSGAFGEGLAAKWSSETVRPLMSIVEAARLAIPSFELTEKGVQRARNGQILAVADFVEHPIPVGDKCLMAWMFRDQLIALGLWRNELTLRVARGFSSCP